MYQKDNINTYGARALQQYIKPEDNPLLKFKYYKEKLPQPSEFRKGSNEEQVCKYYHQQNEWDGYIHQFDEHIDSM